MGQYLKGNNMAQIKIHNGGLYAHVQTSNAYNFCLSWNSTKFIRTFMGQYLNGKHGTDKNYYALAQTSNAYNFCLSWNSTKFIRTFMGQYLKGITWHK